MSRGSSCRPGTQGELELRPQARAASLKMSTIQTRIRKSEISGGGGGGGQLAEADTGRPPWRVNKPA